MRNSRNGAVGYTLVEILVVLGIVTLLAALLLPAFSRVRSNARRATCTSNLKQISVGMALYAQDYRFFPSMDNWSLQNEEFCSPWANLLFPYLKNEHVFECPSSPLGRYRADCPVTPGRVMEQPVMWGGSYDINIPNAAYIRDPVTLEAMKLNSSHRAFSATRYVRPSSTIQVLDGDGQFVSPGYQEPAATDAESLANQGIDAHYEGGVNVAFADGHVKYLSGDALLKRSLWRLNGPE